MLTSTKLSWSHMDWNRSSHSDFIYITYTLAQPRNNLMSCIPVSMAMFNSSPLKQQEGLDPSSNRGSWGECRCQDASSAPKMLLLRLVQHGSWFYLTPSWNFITDLHNPEGTNLGPRVRKYQGFVPCREMSDGWCTGWVWQMKPGGNGKHVPARRILAISSFQPTPQELYGLYGFTTAAAVIPAVKSVSFWEILFAQGELPMCFTIYIYILCQ